MQVLDDFEFKVDHCTYAYVHAMSNLARDQFSFYFLDIFCVKLLMAAWVKSGGAHEHSKVPCKVKL